MLTHAKLPLLILASLVIGSIATFALTPTLSPETLLEIQNKKSVRECITNISYESGTLEIQTAIGICSKMEVKKITGINNVAKATATVSEKTEPSQGYTSKHSLVLTGSHNYQIYSNRVGASWKNNNSAGLTWGVSSNLKGLWKDAGIRYKKGSLRPVNEKGNYIYFETVEEGLRAKIIAIRERWGKATVSHYLSGWGTDDVALSFDKSKIIKELSDAEFTELFVQQMKKESPGYTNQLVKDGILFSNN